MLELRPSSAKRWLYCTASPAFIESQAKLLPEDTSSVYAEEGTLAHAKAATLLTGGSVADWPDDEMEEHVTRYVQMVRSQVENSGGADLFVEQQVNLFFDMSRTGTTDSAVVLQDCSRVFVNDLKYGAGLIVEAVENPQLAIYALSLIESIMMVYPCTEDTVVVMTICQPRVRDGKPVKDWTVTLKQLYQFCKNVTQAADYIERGEVKFSPSDETCQFCPAIAICAARSAQLLGELPAEPDVLPVEPTEELPTFPDPASLSVEQVSRLCQVSKALRGYLDAVETFVMAKLHAGEEVPGFKLVSGRSSRKWSDEAAAEKFLVTRVGKIKAFKHTLLSPAQAEKLLKGSTDTIHKKFEALVTKPEGAPTLASADDPRPALNINIEREFDSLI